MDTGTAWAGRRLWENGHGDGTTGVREVENEGGGTRGTNFRGNELRDAGGKRVLFPPLRSVHTRLYLTPSLSTAMAEWDAKKWSFIVSKPITATMYIDN